jgi:hypothetical protein
MRFPSEGEIAIRASFHRESIGSGTPGTPAIFLSALLYSVADMDGGADALGGLGGADALGGTHSLAVMQVAVGALARQRVSALAFYCYVFPSYQKTYSIDGQKEVIPPF